MEIKSSEDVLEQIVGFANEVLVLQLQKKALDEEIKSMKQDWKEAGVAVGKVTKVLNRIKARAKMNEADLMEEDILEEKLETNDEIQDKIAQLNE